MSHVFIGTHILINIDLNINAIHAKRVTIQVKDSNLAKRYYNKVPRGALFTRPE
jgi:hypothetical protein